MAKRSKITFPGSQGSSLAGLLENPDGPPLATVLFAHCFTCGKDIAAASRIARHLVQRGFAVLRFDFTGLGNSDGDFSNTNFSSNVQDLIKAADYLREHHAAPSLLIGHSLGGTAVLQASSQIPEIFGTVTIGSPADAHHVEKQFSCDIDRIEKDGSAEVSLAGRKFLIKRQFIDDLRADLDSRIGKIKGAVLIMHSPTDSIVSVNEAEKIYKAATHPKSFVSLDSADHLLTKAKDAEYVAQTVAAWATRYLGDVPPSKPAKARPVVKPGHVVVTEKDHKFAQSVFTDSHAWLADEPLSVGGSNLGPDPYAHLLAALGTCTAMTVRMYAARKKWPLTDVSVEVDHKREHGADCEACDKDTPQIDTLSRHVTLSGELDSTQRSRLLEIADRCPVHRTLHGHLVIKTEEVVT